MEIVRTKAFERCAKAIGATETELKALEEVVAANPEAGDVIKGMKGVRKIRFALGSKGKSGDARAVYIVIRVRDAAYLLLAYAKSKQGDLTNDQRKAVLALLETLK